MQSTINLLRPVENTSVQLITVKEEARRIAFIAFLVSVSVAVVVLLIYLVVHASLSMSQSANTTLKRQLDAQSTKENMLAVVKSRIQVVTKAMEYSKPIDQALVYANQITPPPFLSTFSYNDDGKVVVNYKANSIEDSMRMAATVVSLLTDKHIRNARIDGYGIDKEGIRLIFSFYPTWTNL